MNKRQKFHTHLDCREKSRRDSEWTPGVDFSVIDQNRRSDWAPPGCVCCVSVGVEPCACSLSRSGLLMLYWTRSMGRSLRRGGRKKCSAHRIDHFTTVLHKIFLHFERAVTADNFENVHWRSYENSGLYRAPCSVVWCQSLLRKTTCGKLRWR